MPVNVVAELHPIKRSRIKITASPKPVADIVRELNSGFPLSQARVCLNGEIVKDFSVNALDGDVLSVKFVPGGTPQEAGAGLKAGGWGLMLLGGLSFLIPGAGVFIGTALIGAGLSMALGGTVLLNINIPKLKDREKPENDPSIRGGKNQARPLGRIPVLFGRHRIYPDIAANPHTQIIDGRQYYTQLFCGGYRDCAIDTGSFKLGETYLTDLSQTKDINKILSGADPSVRLEIMQDGEASAIYPHCVHEDAINAPLQREAGGAEPGEKTPGEIICSTPDGTDAINVDIFFHNGLGKYSDGGDLESASVEVRALYKPFGAPDSAYALLGYFNNGSNVVSGAELKTKRYCITKSLAPGQYTVRVERVTPDSEDGKVIDQVYLGSVRSIKSKRPIREERQKDLTVIALRVLATSRMNGILDSFNYVAAAKMPVYSGGGSGPLCWLSAAETRSPASALLYALQGRAAQQKVDPGDIDWPSLEAFYSWCADHDYTCNAYLSESVTIAELMRMIGSTARADILRVDSKISVVQDIERPSPVQLFTPKNSISYSVAMFSADVPGAIALGFVDEDSGYAQNELKVHNTPDGNPPAGQPETIQKADLWGVTNSRQARRIGMYNYACLKNRPFVHTIEADIEYLVCGKGDRIQYAGDIALAGSTQGRIKGVVWAEGVCVGVDTDEPVVMAGESRYAVRIRRADGSIILKDAVPASKRLEKAVAYYPGSGGELYEPFIGSFYAVGEDNVYYEPLNAVYFAEPLAEADAPKAGDVYAFGVRGCEVLDLVITDIQPGQNLTAALTCVEYSPEIFGVDRPGFVLPEFINRITPVSGAVDSGVVNPDRMRLFYAWHDSEEEPERPSGDGQENGWHRLQTYRSVWQSAKTAESADSGEWGLPVRMRAERGGDDVTPIWLSLSPQCVTLETDGDGNLLAGLLPFTVQARLHKWNSVLSGVAFSLAGAPPGVSADPLAGVITVAADAVLGEANNITVRAVYRGAAYTAMLCIEKNINNSAPRYLGTVTALQATAAAVTIIKGPVTGQAVARQGDYVLAVAAVCGRLAGSVFQWTGTAWEYRAPENYSDLYIRCFKDGLDIPELSQDMGWFGAVFARLLVAQQAFIKELSAQVVKLQAGGAIESNDYDPGKAGFKIAYDGYAEFNNAKFRGHIEAITSSFESVVIGKNSKFLGIIDSDSLQVNFDPSSIKRFPVSGTYAVGTSNVTIRNDVYSFLGFNLSESKSFIVDDGEIAGNKINAIAIDTYGTPSSPSVWIRIGLSDGSFFQYMAATVHTPFWFQIGNGGKKVRFVGLSQSPVGQQGTLYIKQSGSEKYLMIT